MVLAGVAMSAELSENEVRTLVKELGDDGFRTRRDAKKSLEACSRSAVPILESFLESPDPEVRLEVKRLIAMLKGDPNKIPYSAFRLKSPDGALSVASYDDQMKNWRDKRVLAAKMDDGRTGIGGSSMAQSFKPKTDTIAAVEFGSYPIGSGHGWLMLDVREDEDGAPGQSVLARAWIHIDKPAPNLINKMLVYDIPDITVKPDESYWLVFREFSAGNGQQNIVNVGMHSSSEYKDGVMWLEQSRRASKGSVLKFRIVSKCGSVPLLEKSDEGIEKILPPAKQDWTRRDRRSSGARAIFQ